MNRYFKVFNMRMLHVKTVAASTPEEALMMAKEQGIVAPTVELILTEQEQRQKDYEEMSKFYPK